MDRKWYCSGCLHLLRPADGIASFMSRTGTGIRSCHFPSSGARRHCRYNAQTGHPVSQVLGQVTADIGGGRPQGAVMVSESATNAARRPGFLRPTPLDGKSAICFLRLAVISYSPANHLLPRGTVTDVLSHNKRRDTPRFEPPGTVTWKNAKS
jgi:hypothetical protein